MATARSKVGILQPGCPRIALASCPARAVHRLTDHCPCADNVWHFSDSRSFLLQWGGGLLACARRAAGLQLSCCAPGSSPAYYRCAGWMGLCPAGPAQGAPPPASPAPALPIPARHGPSFRFAPLTLSQSHNSTHIICCVPRFVEVSTRAFERGALRPLSMRF